MKKMRVAVLAAGLMLLGSGVPASGQEAAFYSNVEVVSVDVLRRLVVVKNASGTRETLQLDDRLAGPAGVKAGDLAMMTVRGGPGRKRISAITRLVATSAAPGVAAVPPAPRSAAVDPERVEVRARFAGRVADLSQQARPIDAVWSSFVTTCDARHASGADGAREWFGLWDGRVTADLSSGFCRDLFNQMVGRGEGVKRAMAAAEDVARRVLTAGEVRDIRRLNSMDWDGWMLPAPGRLGP